MKKDNIPNNPSSINNAKKMDNTNSSDRSKLVNQDISGVKKIKGTDEINMPCDERMNLGDSKKSTNLNSDTKPIDGKKIDINGINDNVDKNNATSSVNRCKDSNKKDFSPEIDYMNEEKSRFFCSSRKKHTKLFNWKSIKKKYLVNPKIVLKIFKTDVKEIFRNPAVLIIVIGLTIVPSLYAWFNIKAFWDPYSNTKFLKVAIVNQDIGTTFRNQDLKLGQKVVDNLKKNDNLDWQFVDYKRAEKGLKSGEYYAIIRIPKDFSENLTSIVKKDVKKATIDYTVNEKLNAIAPKITDKGANAIQQKVDEALVETVSKVSFGALGAFSNTFGDIDPYINKMKDSLNRLNAQLDNIDKLTKNGKSSLKDTSSVIQSLKKSLPNINSTVKNSKNLNNDLRATLNQMNSSFNNLVPNIKSDLDLINTLTGQTSELVDSISSNGNTLNEDMKSLLYRVDSKTSNTINMLQGIISVLNNLNTGNSSALNLSISSLESALKSLQQMNAITIDSIRTIDSGQNLSNSTLSQMSNLATSVNRNTVDILNNFDAKVAQPLNKIHSNSLKVSSDLEKILNNTSDIYPNVTNLVNNASSINKTLASTTDLTQNSVSILKEQVKSTLDSLNKIQNNKDFKEFNDVIKSNIMSRVDFLKNPVELHEKKIFKIKNYGSAMAPFYSVLASWVGVLVLLTVLTTDVKGKIRTVDEYFGRMMLFTVLSIFQSIIISLGDFFILGVTVESPVVFSLILIFSSIVFTSIIYSLVSALGTAGKGVSIFLLVIQIGGSGGTFPIQMTPHFFKMINSIIPFTYAIDACREAVGGIYWPNLRMDLLTMAIFYIVPIILSVLLKEKLNRLTSPMSKMFKNSFLIGH